MQRIAVIGNISRDLIHRPGYPDAEQLGGAALYLALAAARVGHRAAPVSVVGDDLAHLPTAPALHDLDWSALGIAELPSHSAAFDITYDPQGHLTACHAAYGAAGQLTRHALEHITGHPGDRYHISCRRPLDTPAVLRALTTCRASFSLDFHLPSAAANIEAAAPWLSAAHTVFLNQAEHRILTQHAAPDAIAELIITDGPRPARLLLHGTEHASYPPPVTRPLDVTGAGDTLAGTYLAHRAHDADPREALVHAVQTASRHTTTPRLPLPRHT